MGASCAIIGNRESMTAGNDMDCSDYFAERCRDEVEEWLTNLGLSHYFELFLDNGFDQMHIIRSTMKDNSALLQRIGISKIGHQMTILKAIDKLNNDEDSDPVISVTAPGSLQSIICDEKPLLSGNGGRSDSVPSALVGTWECEYCLNMNTDGMRSCVKCKEKRIGLSPKAMFDRTAVDV